MFQLAELFCSPRSAIPVLTSSGSGGGPLKHLLVPGRKEGLQEGLTEAFLGSGRESVREEVLLNAGEGRNCSDSIKESGKVRKQQVCSQSVSTLSLSASENCEKQLHRGAFAVTAPPKAARQGSPGPAELPAS